MGVIMGSACARVTPAVMMPDAHARADSFADLGQQVSYGHHDALGKRATVDVP